MATQQGHGSDVSHTSTSDQLYPAAGYALSESGTANALNAAMAVIRWKKLCGFYLDLEGEHHSVYVIDGNHLLNEDTQEL